LLPIVGYVQDGAEAPATEAMALKAVLNSVMWLALNRVVLTTSGESVKVNVVANALLLDGPRAFPDISDGVT
jgi:hypothetical protein